MRLFERPQAWEDRPTQTRGSSDRKRLGDAGERLAAARLTEQGYRIVETQWRRREGEIDIIAWDGPCLVFVEVRTRRGDRSGSPEESVSPAKQRTLWRLAELYLASIDPAIATSGSEWPPECRFDVVAIELHPATGRIERCDILVGVMDGTA